MQSATFFPASGKLHAATGSVTIIRASGVARATVGDLLYAGDVIETGPDGEAGITFPDGTAFILLSNSRLLLNEFACHPNGFANSALFRLDRGSCSFIAGSAAKSDQLRLETPIATIRATAQDGGVAILTMAALLFCGIRQTQGSSPDLVLADHNVDDDLVTYSTYNLTTKDGRVIPIEHPGEIVVIHPLGSGTSVERLTATPEQMEQFREMSQATRELLHATSGSGTPPLPALDFNPLQPINFIQPVDHSITVTSHDLAPDQPIHDIFLPPSLPPPRDLPSRRTAVAPVT
jgi:FecR protein